MVQVYLGSKILAANEIVAQNNRVTFDSHCLLVLNLMSSPGSGKTTILERAIERINGQLQIGVIEGDLYTVKDAMRIEAKGIPVVQINTEGACHLDADMVGQAFHDLYSDKMDLIIIENVGNLVCPAEFDLGEHYKIVVISITEGNDKPLKYPLIFQEATAVLVNKIDLLPYTDFNLEQFEKDVAQVNPSLNIFRVSARTGEGIQKWCAWLTKEVQKKRFQQEKEASC